MRVQSVLDSSPVAFDWNNANICHIARHNIAPDEVEQCYCNDPLVIEEQFVSGELRFLALGETNAFRRLAFVFTIRYGKIRFVTAYPMTQEQQNIYEEG